MQSLEAVSGDTLGLRHFLPPQPEITKMVGMEEIDLVEAYRHTFAGLLAAASQLKKHEGR